MRFCYLSGLSPRFQGLSRSSWAGCLRITHPFASISSQQAGHPSIDLHVLGTPPAFILSQDQTLHLIDSYSTGSFTSFLHKSWRSFLCFIFLFSFQRAFRCPFEQPDDYLILSSRCQLFFHKFFPYVICSLSAHSKCLFTLPWSISSQYSPTARLYYLIPFVLASTVFSDRHTCMHVFIKQTFGFWLIYNNFFTTYKIIFLKIFSDFFKYVFAI